MKNLTMAFLITAIVACPLTTARADWHGHSHGGWHHRGYHDHFYFGLNLSPDIYYSDYYNPGYVLASPAPIYQPVMVNGMTYYLNNGQYYTYNGYGYQSVTPPVTILPAVSTASPVVGTPTASAPENSFTINIPNEQGGYTAVILTKSGNGYTGPQGEFYADFPSVAQLKAMYGKSKRPHKVEKSQ